MLGRAIRDLKQGKFVLVYDADDREEETDLVIASFLVKQEHIKLMRKDGGGLICVTVDSSTADKLKLPYLTDLFVRSAERYKVFEHVKAKDIPYDEHSAFSLTINHRNTFTGITDKDRALTISEFGKLVARYGNATDGFLLTQFGKSFRAPGHVHLLNASKGLLSVRKGHTELSTALLILAGLPPSACICEMLADDGKALSKQEAQRYARAQGLVFLEGSEIVEAWEHEKGNG